MIFLSLHFLHPVRTFRWVLRAPYGLGRFEPVGVVPPLLSAVAVAVVALRLRLDATGSRVLGLFELGLELRGPEPEPVARYMFSCKWQATSSLGLIAALCLYTDPYKLYLTCAAWTGETQDGRCQIINAKGAPEAKALTFVPNTRHGSDSSDAKCTSRYKPPATRTLFIRYGFLLLRILRLAVF